VVLRIRQLGRVPYREALALQRALAARGADDYLLLLEHPHVYTLGVRADPAHVLVEPAAVGAELVAVDRGGDVTYHGPGQLVVYPVLTVADDPGTGPAHVRRLEQVAIDALEDLGVGARAGATRGTPASGSGRRGVARARWALWGCAPCGSGAAAGPSTGWRSTSTATWRCSPTSCRAGSPTCR
jgi:lipoate-protein ligase B